MRRAFTLVELLVVVTIIIILLALLMPAMGKAVYQAQLTQCGASLRATATGVIQYAMANKRYYPDRDLDRIQEDGTYQYSYIHASTLTYKVASDYDMRPYIKDYVSINKQLVDPLCQPVELEKDVADDENVGASYAMWWGWRYDLTSSRRNPGDRGARLAGMFKLGDRWEWKEGNAPSEYFRLLAGDYDLYLGGDDPNPVQGSHPDHDKLMAPFAVKYVPLAGAGAGIPITLSIWMRVGANDRGPIDMNHVYDDGSVARLNGVGRWWAGGKLDERMTRVGSQANQQQFWKFYQVPRN